MVERRKWVTAALMLSMAVAALEQTVVSTAMPTIIGELHGLRIYPWVFSIYLLVSTVTMPLYGKLADLYGRKRLVLIGIGLFSIGSILSGLAQSMPQLIAARGVQGLGAGAIMPVTLTILGDIYSLEERARIQGLFSGVWGIASLAGPALGALLTVSLSWRWVFLVNIPVGLAAIAVLIVAFKERIEPQRVHIDYVGAVLLTVAASALLSSVLGGSSLPRAGAWGLVAISVLALGAFIRNERRVVDPILPADLFTNPQILTSFVGSFLVGTTIFGIDTYVPLFVQGVRGGSAISAGAVVTPLLFSWSMSTMVAAPLILRWAFRKVAILGTTLVAVGLGSLVMATAADAPTWAVTASMIVTGLGLGPTSTSFVLGAQNAVPWNRRGVATSGVSFFRTIGGALGVALLGGLLTAGIEARLASAGAEGLTVSAALVPETRTALTPEDLALVQGALAGSLHWVFIAMLGVAIGGVTAALVIREPRFESLPVVDPLHQEVPVAETTGD